MKQTNIKNVMIIWQTIYGALSIFGYLPHVFSVSLFDGNPHGFILFEINSLFFSYYIFVLAYLLTLYISWMSYRRGKYETIKWLNLIPLIPVGLGLFGFISVVCLLGWK